VRTASDEARRVPGSRDHSAKADTCLRQAGLTAVCERHATGFGMTPWTLARARREARFGAAIRSGEAARKVARYGARLLARLKPCPSTGNARPRPSRAHAPSGLRGTCRWFGRFGCRTLSVVCEGCGRWVEFEYVATRESRFCSNHESVFAATTVTIRGVPRVPVQITGTQNALKAAALHLNLSTGKSFFAFCAGRPYNEGSNFRHDVRQ
jgi:hypothetical protein